MRKRIPNFKTEDQERKFWASHDSSDYLDWNKGKKLVLPELKPSVVSISIRLPESMLEELKLLANKTDIPYQSLMKMFLSERLQQEFVSKRLSKKSSHGHRSDLAA
jgi:predicted DNA binding CopG/RHH family protein